MNNVRLLCHRIGRAGCDAARACWTGIRCLMATRQPSQSRSAFGGDANVLAFVFRRRRDDAKLRWSKRISDGAASCAHSRSRADVSCITKLHIPTISTCCAVALFSPGLAYSQTSIAHSNRELTVARVPHTSDVAQMQWPAEHVIGQRRNFVWSQPIWTIPAIRPAQPPPAPPAPVSAVQSKGDPVSSEPPMMAWARTVYFDFNSSVLSSAAQKLLEGFPTYLSPAKVQIVGHTDAVGTATFNDALGLDRARSVSRWLSASKQIPDGAIELESQGKARPADTNTTAEGRAANRRVTIVTQGTSHADR